MDFQTLLNHRVQDAIQKNQILVLRQKFLQHPEALSALKRRLEGDLEVNRFLTTILPALKISHDELNISIEQGISSGRIREELPKANKYAYALNEILEEGFPRVLITGFSRLEKETRIPSKRTKSTGYCRPIRRS